MQYNIELYKEMKHEFIKMSKFTKIQNMSYASYINNQITNICNSFHSNEPVVKPMLQNSIQKLPARKRPATLRTPHCKMENCCCRAAWRPRMHTSKGLLHRAFIDGVQRCCCPTVV